MGMRRSRLPVHTTSFLGMKIIIIRPEQQSHNSTVVYGYDPGQLGHGVMDLVPVLPNHTEKVDQTTVIPSQQPQKQTQ